MKFSRPSGTFAQSCVTDPGDKSPGYFRKSLRDKRVVSTRTNVSDIGRAASHRNRIVNNLHTSLLRSCCATTVAKFRRCLHCGGGAPPAHDESANFLTGSPSESNNDAFDPTAGVEYMIGSRKATNDLRGGTLCPPFVGSLLRRANARLLFC